MCLCFFIVWFVFIFLRNYGGVNNVNTVLVNMSALFCRTTLLTMRILFVCLVCLLKQTPVCGQGDELGQVRSLQIFGNICKHWYIYGSGDVDHVIQGDTSPTLALFRVFQGMDSKHNIQTQNIKVIYTRVIMRDFWTITFENTNPRLPARASLR